MIENFEITQILHNKHNLEQKLASMIYGSVEIREKELKKYIYVHYREDGRLLSKYVGEYTEDLYNLILHNNDEVKNIKKEIKELEKRLKELNFEGDKLTNAVKINIDFAKRNLVDTIYKQAILEGVATTYADTESIIEGGKVNGMTPDDILKVVNLKHAWEFVLNENVLLSEENFYLLSQINKLVLGGFYYNAGKVRSTPAKIGGTSWAPTIPFESQVIEEIKNIVEQDINGVDLAIQLLLYIMKKQVFIDGNKRTAILFANHHLISRGLGIIVIPADLSDKFKKLLILYYEGKDDGEIIKFLKCNCYIKI